MVQIELQRFFHADPQEVYLAWSDVDRLRRWIAPTRDFRVTQIESDPRKGGALEIQFEAPGGMKAQIRGRWLELQVDRSIRLDWRAQLPGFECEESSVVELQFCAQGQGTLLKLRQGEFELEERAQQWRDVWGAALGRLPLVLERALKRFFERVSNPPRQHSAFGGLWTDFANWRERIEGKLELGNITPGQARQLEDWCRQGYLVMEGALDTAGIDSLRAEVDGIWSAESDDIWCEVFEGDRPRFEKVHPKFHAAQHKLLDLHGASEKARAVLFSSPLLEFLGLLFERPPLAFQTLTFAWGTEQAMHQDTAFVLLRSPLEFVGCWIALEDVQAGSGELEYYEGSHRIDEYRWLDQARAKPYDYDDQSEFLAWMHAGPKALGCPLRRFAPKRGDVLLWHADLVHGGSKVTTPSQSRKSLVAHFCPKDVDPEWFGSSEHSPKLRDPSGGYYCYQIRR